MGLFSKQIMRQIDEDLSYMDKCAICGTRVEDMSDEDAWNGEEIRVGRYKKYWVCGPHLQNVWELFPER